MHAMRITELTERAEKLSRKTGNGSCLLCRHMLVRDSSVACCTQHPSGREVYLIGGMNNCLPSMTVRARSCKNYDSML